MKQKYAQLPNEVYNWKNCGALDLEVRTVVIYELAKHKAYLSSNMLLMYVPTTALTGRTVSPRIARNIATELVDHPK